MEMQRVISTMTPPRLVSEKSKLQKGGMVGTTILTSLVLSACGATVPTNDGGFTGVGNTFTGTEVDNILSQSGSTANLTVSGLGGADEITTGSGADVVRAGSGDDTVNTGFGVDVVRAGTGADTVNTGSGNDIIVVVGTTSASQYSAANIPSDISGVLTLSTLNGQLTSESVSGDIINGGAGTDTLHVYGTTDLSLINLISVETLSIHSIVTATASQFESFSVINGDGSSTLHIKLNDPTSTGIEVTLADLNLTNINQIFLEDNVTLQVANVAELDSVGISILSGPGTVEISGFTDIDDVQPTVLLDDQVTVVTVISGSSTDITTGIALAQVTPSDTGNFTPEFIGRATVYLDPIASGESVTLLANLSAADVNSTVDGFFSDPENQSISFTLSGTDASQFAIQIESDGSSWLALKAGQTVTAGSSLDVDVTGTDTSGGVVSQNFDFWAVAAGSITGTGGNDILLGGATAETINGGDGNDHINGGYGNDTLTGGNGNDLLKGRFGDDMLTGGAGQDTLYYQIQEVNGKFVTADGNDTMLDFTIGTDVIQFDEYQVVGNETDTLAEFKAGFNDTWTAQISADSNQIKLEFGDSAVANGTSTITLVINSTNLQTSGSEGYQAYTSVDTLLTDLGGDTALDFV